MSASNAERRAARLYLALVHHPVVNRMGETIASAVTNLDLHDIARAARTYGARGFFVATPLSDQRELARRIVFHWTRGAGAEYNPDRRSAMELVRVAGSLKEAVDAVGRIEREPPRVVATCAQPHSRSITHAGLRDALGDGRPCLLVFGTAWGLAAEVIAAADEVLEPIRGGSDYNHLSVRSAVAIVLDRLVGEEKNEV
jgi:hypothetical protein